MPELPLVTVAIPCYRHAAYLETCLRSVAEQRRDHPALQILAIDDGSDDGTAEILARLGPELGLEWECAPHRGLMPTLADLLGRARGAYYMTLGSDDALPPGRVRRQVEYLQTRPEVFGCAGQALAMDAEGALRPLPRYRRGIPEIAFEDLFLGRREILSVSAMWRLDLFLASGGYQLDKAMEDFPMWLRLTRRFGPMPVLDEVFVHYRVHGSNLHLDHDRMYPSYLAALTDHADHPLYPRAVAAWKSGWFSSLCETDRGAALRALPRLATWSPDFLRRLPKLFLPRVLQRLLSPPA